MFNPKILVTFVLSAFVPLWLLAGCATPELSPLEEGNGSPESPETTVESPTETTTEPESPRTEQVPQTAEEEEVAVRVYFAKSPESDEDFTYVEPVWRKTQSQGVARFAVNQLMVGPTEAEARLGLKSLLELSGPSNCGEDFKLAIAQQVADLQFCRQVMLKGLGHDAQLLSTLEATLKQFPTVDQVVIRDRNGNCLADQSGENHCLDKLPRQPQSNHNQQSTTPLTEQSKLTLTGMGAVQVGMTIAQASQVTGMRFTQQASGGEEYGCLFYRPPNLSDVFFMVTEGKIARVETGNPRISTLSGAKIGDTEARIRSLYPGQIVAEPHEYVPGGKYLFFMPQDSAQRNYRVVFETDAQGRVTRIRTGKMPEVGYIEGCV
ncbi:GerMN domain-containing protein [Spirulina subsalsa]|uniref:GerMN domain-containing protein n=1 Tax=Spirulina subsalsa TaxID=54311 RepID=UPI00030A96D0|nr:GerMN domain-containing protein [Spirulina subsalsa]